MRGATPKFDEFSAPHPEAPQAWDALMTATIRRGRGTDG
jgi:hypothetical protein